MARIERSIEVEIPTERVWDLVTDYKHFPSFIKSVKKVDILTEKPDFVGGKTHWVFESGNQNLEWDAETTERIENEKISWRSISGMKNSGFWLLKPTESGTSITLVMDYELPYSILGKIIDKLKVEKDFSKSVEESLETVKKILEHGVRTRARAG